MLDLLASIAAGEDRRAELLPGAGNSSSLEDAATSMPNGMPS